MFGDITTLPIVIQSVQGIYLGLVYMAAFTFATLYIATKVFSTERIMTARLTFSWRKAKSTD